jgi:hypothetical protein
MQNIYTLLAQQDTVEIHSVGLSFFNIAPLYGKSPSALFFNNTYVY